MPQLQYSSSDNSQRVVSNEDVNIIYEKIKVWFENVGLEIHYFKISWYNQVVASEYRLSYHPDTLAFVIISKPCMFEKAFLPFLSEMMKSTDIETSSDPLDKCMIYNFQLLKKKLYDEIGLIVETIHDFELIMPYRRPKILLQTAAHVSGSAYYYKIQNAKQKLGVCIHPLYGGWFGIRGAFICHQLLAPDLIQRPSLDIVPPEKQIELLHLFNNCWKDMSYRNIIPVKERYSPMQIEYFRLKPKERFEYIRSTILPSIERNGYNGNCHI